MTRFDALLLVPHAPAPLARDRSALLWPLLGRPLIGHALHAARAAGAEQVALVVGPGAEIEPLAAVARAGEALLLRVDLPTATPQDGDDSHVFDAAFLEAALGRSAAETVLVLDAGAALVKPATLRQLADVHAHERAAASRLLAVAPRPGPQPACVCLFEREAALHALRALLAAGRTDCDLGDLFVALVESGRVVATAAADEPAELAVASSAAGLAAAAAVLRERRNLELLLAGVVIEDPSSTWVDVTADVAPGALLRPSCLLEGRTSVAAGAEIGPFARLVDVTVESGALVLDHCLLRECLVESGASVGPFAHVRPQSRIRRGARVGNFVELKKTDLGEGSKAPHLTYLGDASVGSGVNVGAGTITCNYDGVTKHPTRIEDGAFIGSDTTLIAPVTVGAGAYVGAGSTLSRDVAPDSLTLTRAELTVRPGWAARQRAKRQARES